MGGHADRTVEEKKEGSRKVQRKAATNQNNVDREVGFDRGLTMQLKMQCASERHVELKLKTSKRMNLRGSEAQVFSLINLLMEKLERLNEDLIP